MIIYKLYKYPQFEEIHKGYFNSLLEIVKQQKYLSPNIEEIIITDDIVGEIDRYCVNHDKQSALTITREYKAIAKTINFDGKRKIFFDAINFNGYLKHTPQIFFEQLLEVYAEDIVSNYFKVPQTFYAGTPFTEVIKMFFAQWATKVVANTAEKLLDFEQIKIHFDVKMFVDAFKRNIRKLHYQYQENKDLDTFWIKTVTELDYLIRRCLDVKFDEGRFEKLQEFNKSIPPLLLEIETQTQQLLSNREIDYTIIRKHLLEILKTCFVEIRSEQPMFIKIIESPKKLFKGNLVDTEPRIVAFIDILGFSNIIQEYDSDKTSNILNDLHETLELAVKISIENMLDSKAKTDLQEFLEYRMFSDCICISLPYIEFGNDFHIQFHSIATVVKSYQLAMMQKGFFVRGGISIGSFFADKNMIFSGGLVSAYKLEQKIGHPIIAIDKKVLERLDKNFSENSKNLFLENTLIYPDNESDKIFLNPYDLLDNSSNYFDYLQSTMDDLIKENEKDSDEFSDLTNSLLKMTNSFTKPIFDYAKSQMTPEKLNQAKEEILELINEQFEKQSNKLSKIPSNTKEAKEIKKIITKYEFLKRLTNWSLGQTEHNLFQYFTFSD